MQNMVFDYLKIAVVLICIVYLIVYSINLLLLIRRVLNRKYDLKAIELENEKISNFMKMDPKVAEDEIDTFISKYIDEYVLKNFIINKITYIKEQQANEMIRYVEKRVLVDLSELYVFYIKILVTINDENDLITYIDKKVKDHVLIKLTDFNKQIKEQ